MILLLGKPLGDSEVSDAHLEVLFQENIGCFDVSVHDSVRVEGRQSQADLAEDFEDRFLGEQRELPADEAAQVSALAVLGNYVELGFWLLVMGFGSFFMLKRENRVKRVR